MRLDESGEDAVPSRVGCEFWVKCRRKNVLIRSSDAHALARALDKGERGDAPHERIAGARMKTPVKE